MISPFLPILRFPKFFEIEELGAGVPLCATGSLERTLTAVWPLLLIIAIIAVIFIICILIGRAMCAWACPIGLIQDLITKTRSVFKVSSKEFSLKTHKKMVVVKYAILFAVMILSISIGASFMADQATGEIYNSYFPAMAQSAPTCVGCPTPIIRYIVMDVGFYGKPNLADWTSWLQLFIFGIFIVGAVAIPRFWCRYLCPMGALSSCFNKTCVLTIKKDHAKCTKCEVCADVCPTRVRKVIDEKEDTRVVDTNCTYCLDCIEACPDKALTLEFGGKTIYRGREEWWEKK
jgi:polyferredoxin